jgi:hypothetical protein
MHLRTLPYDKRPPAVRPRPYRRDVGDLAHYLPWVITMICIAIGVAT